MLNREDMISNDDRNDWARYFAKQGIKVIFTNGKLGMVCFSINLILMYFLVFFFFFLGPVGLIVSE